MRCWFVSVAVGRPRCRRSLRTNVLRTSYPLSLAQFYPQMPPRRMCGHDATSAVDTQNGREISACEWQECGPKQDVATARIIINHFMTYTQKLGAEQ